MFKKDHTKIIVELIIPGTSELTQDSDVSVVYDKISAAVRDTVNNLRLPTGTLRNVSEHPLSAHFEDYKKYARFQLSYWTVFLMTFGAGIFIVPHKDDEWWKYVIRVITSAFIITRLSTFINWQFFKEQEKLNRDE
jgi:hypothetical protein